jgi:hypothetical protein
MLNAKLQKGVTLMHVIARTQALGELLSEKDEKSMTKPEIFRWTDGTKSHVTCTFMGGKLQSWELFRPLEKTDEALEAEKSVSAA